MNDKYISIYEKLWKDLEDNGHVYKKGDSYPREGLEVSKKRIKELSGDKNKIGKILIQKIEDNIGDSGNIDNTDNVDEE